MASASGLLRDHLGSTAVTANASGAKTGELRYYPYGSTRSTWGTTPTTYRFTGQREESTIGLYFYNARWYDPVLGRFVQPDPLVPEPGHPQALNRYAYVLNNPIRYTDPSGHCVAGIDTAVCVAAGLALLKAIDYGWTAWDVYQSGRTLSDPNASDLDRRLAELNIILALSLEGGEPDDILPVSLPADDLARRGLIRTAREALAAGDETALRNLPDWLRPMVRGMVTEERILTALGRQGQKRLIEGRVGDEIVKTIPDFVDDANKIVGEIKDVAELGWEKQLQAQYAWAQEHGYTLQLFIRRNTVRQGQLAGDLKKLRDQGIDIQYIEDILR